MLNITYLEGHGTFHWTQCKVTSTFWFRQKSPAGALCLRVGDRRNTLGQRWKGDVNFHPIYVYGEKGVTIKDIKMKKG